VAGRSPLLDRVLPAARTPEERLLAQVAAGGARFRRLHFTRNRRVMISVGDGGETLRVNERFRDAPPAVLRAVGQLYGPRGPTRQAARARIADFLAENPPIVAAARAPRRRRVPPADRPHLERLQAEFDRVNAEAFGGALPRVPLFLSGRMKRRNGHFSADPLEIVVSRRLCLEGADDEAVRTLRHEMIHLWQHHEGRRPDHGAEFRRWARRLDIHPRAVRTVEWRSAGC
jgi:hypothetical protein